MDDATPPLLLTHLPTELIFEVALLVSPLRALRPVVRFDRRLVACVRLQRWSRRQRLRRRPRSICVGDRVLVRPSGGSKTRYATAAAKVTDGWKLRTLVGEYITVPSLRVRLLEEWADGPWASSVGLSAAKASASWARGAATHATAVATVALERPGAPTPQTALAIAAATAASTAAAAATAASSAAVPAGRVRRLSGSLEAREARELLLATQQMQVLAIARAGAGGAAAPDDAVSSPPGADEMSRLVAQAATAAAVAATEAEAAASAAAAAAATEAAALAASAATAAKRATATIAAVAAGSPLPLSDLFVPVPTMEAVFSFLRNANPAAYGGPDTRATDVQEAALEDAANGLTALMRAAQGPTGEMPASDCPIHWAAEDSRNVWALEGRFRAPTRTVELPLVGITATLQQRWRQHGVELDDEVVQVEGHSTATACWDGAVVLADLLCQPSSVLLSHSPTLARSPSAYAEWRWADKSVLELGCGISALPALVASLQGARRVVATDANDAVLRVTRENAKQWLADHPSATPLSAVPLRWGEDEDVRAQLAASGVATTFDVILAADYVYVLENPGAWGKLLATIAALSTPTTLVFVTYTDRGHNKMWERFVAQRVSKLFHVVPVAPHLLHPVAQPGAPGRLEQQNPACQIFCWTLKE